MKAENNPFPSILVVEGTTPTAPSAGDQRLFIDSADHTLKRVNSSGTVTTVEGGGGSSAIELGYTEVTTAQTINTVGSWQDITGLSVTVTIGSRPVVIWVELPYATFNTAGSVYNIALYDVTAAAFIFVWGQTNPVANGALPVSFHRRHNPGAGARTYKVRAFLNNAGDTIVTPGLADRPSSIQVLSV